MQIHEKLPLVLRCATIVLGVIITITASAGGIRTCTFGKELYSSTSEIDFLLATGVLIILGVGLRVLAFDVKRRRLPSIAALLMFDSFYVLLTFSSALAVALSPVGNQICADKNDLKAFMEEVCEFHCSNVVAAVVLAFFAFVLFLASILFTTKVIVAGSTGAAEDFTFNEDTTAQKAKANTPSKDPVPV